MSEFDQQLRKRKWTGHDRRDAVHGDRSSGEHWLAGSLARAYTTDLIPAFVVNDVATSSLVAYADVTGLVFPVENGILYSFNFWGTYKSSNATTGIGIGLTWPGAGNARARVVVAEASAVAITADWIIAKDTTVGTTIVDTIDVARYWEMTGRYQCAADGVLQVRFIAKANAGTVTIQAGSSGDIKNY
jgi:hypothetical protein